MKRGKKIEEAGDGDLPTKRVTRQSTQGKSRQVVDMRRDDHKLQPVSVQKSNESSCVTLSDSEDTHIGEGSQASGEKYPILAINRYNTSNKNSQIELVETGPLAVGYLSTGDRIIHLNFKAKRKGGSDLQTFFSELTETKQNGVSVDSVEHIGPSDLLLDEADTRGCLYCSNGIHHPKYSGSFRSGREKYWNALCSKVDEFNKYAWRKRIKEEDFRKRFSDPGLEYLGDRPTTIDRFALVALRVVNTEEGSDFELVKIGPVGLVGLPIGLVLHVNFEAKNKDDRDAARQTFFAEAIECGSYFFINFWKCLGPSLSLPDEADLRGCCYCKSGVHHPPGPGYITGRK